jgi:hypothetical protein
VVWSPPEQIVRETLSRKYLTQKGVAQGVGPQFKPQYHKKMDCKW